MNKNEIRTFALEDVAIREIEGQEAGESRVITGTAIVFNAESEVLDENGVKFREVIKPEAAQMAFLNTQDIKLSLLHSRNDTIGRSRMGRGNLHYSVDGRGVNFEVEVPRCDLGDRALEMVRSGVYTGCSFEFVPDKYDVQERSDKEVLVTHTRFKRISAFTLGMDPAYQQTSCNAREMYEATPEGKAAKEAEEQAKREDEAKAEAERKAQEEREEREREEAIKREMHRRLEHMKHMSNFDEITESKH